jgi:hypothetical protein
VINELEKMYTKAVLSKVMINYPGICLEALLKTIKSLHQKSRLPARSLNVPNTNKEQYPPDREVLYLEIC